MLTQLAHPGVEVLKGQGEKRQSCWKLGESVVSYSCRSKNEQPLTNKTHVKFMSPHCITCHEPSGWNIHHLVRGFSLQTKPPWLESGDFPASPQALPHISLNNHQKRWNSATGRLGIQLGIIPILYPIVHPLVILFIFHVHLQYTSTRKKQGHR